MPIKHVTQQLEAFLDNRLSAADRRMVEEHLALCPLCQRRLYEVRRVSGELGSVLKTALGQPIPPPALRYQVRQAISRADSSRSLPWAAWGRAFNAVISLAVLALLVAGVWAVIRSQLSGASSDIHPLGPVYGGGELPTATTTPNPQSSPPTPNPQPRPLSSLSDTLPPLSPRPTPANVPTQTIQPDKWPLSTSGAQEIPTPSGLIAFSVFNPAPDRQVYEIHLIDLACINSPAGCESSQRVFALSGVSEPALNLDGQYLAYRAWSEPTSPRSLLSSNLAADTPNRVGGFWEDAQPDWSPTEYRLIFASQRESDRRWRLYTSWGDGTREVNLRREGRSPTFAPDGYRFAFESCDGTGNQCGLWLGDLEHSEYESRPFLEDPLARAPDWSPVGEQIAYMANPNGNWDLYLVNSSGTGVRRLTTDPAVDGLPAWSSDGQWLAFLSNRGGDWGLWLLQMDTGQVRQLVSLAGMSFTPPQRSPYGQRDWLDEQISWGR